MPAEQLTPEQLNLREVTAKWLNLSHTSLLDTKPIEEFDWFWNQTNEWTQNYFRQLADSLLAIQQAAGAVLKDSDQSEPDSNKCPPLPYENKMGIRFMTWGECWEQVQKEGFVKVQPLTGGKS